MLYQKPHATLSDQLECLKKRGLIIDDEQRTKHYLYIVGYYRLSSYCYQFELPPRNGTRTHQFKEKTSFDDIVRVYVFDQKLRNLMLEALERFEVAIKSVWAHEISQLNGAHPHMIAELFKDKNEHCRSLNKLRKATENAKSNSEEIAHYLNHYDGPSLPPIWIITSVMSFGELFRWLKNTKSTPVKKTVAKAMGIPNIRMLEGISRALTTVRNICAHNGRLWDRRLSTKLPHLKNNLIIPLEAIVDKCGREQSDPRMYNFIVILAHLMLSLNQSNTWRFRVASLVKEKLTKDEQNIMGFPSDWETNPFWIINSDQ